MSSNELLAVIENMEKERGIDRDFLIQMVEAALISASKKSVGPARDMRVEIDRKTLSIKAYNKVEVVAQVASKNTQIALADARRIKPDVQLGELVETEIAAKDFGRIAAQTAKQAIIQRIRQAEKEIVVSAGLRPRPPSKPSSSASARRKRKLSSRNIRTAWETSSAARSSAWNGAT